MVQNMAGRAKKPPAKKKAAKKSAAKKAPAKKPTTKPAVKKAADVVVPPPADSRNEYQRKLMADKRRQENIIRHVVVPAASMRRRQRHGRKLESWLRYYLHEEFSLPFSDDHRKVIQALETSIKEGGLFADAMPRGDGKTTMAKGAILFSILHGFRKYPVALGADAKRGKEILDFVKIALRFNDRIAADWPILHAYVAHMEGKAIKCHSQLRPDGVPGSMEWGAEKIVLPNMKGHPDAKKCPWSCAVVESKGLTGGFRGMSHALPGGGIIRPDFALLDDPQTRESAKSPTQCDDRENIIRGDVLGLAGPTTRIAAVMPCTVIFKGDLADRMLDRERNPEWQGIKTKMVVKWPDAQDTLWVKYSNLYKECKREGNNDLTAAWRFYEENRKAMDAGAVVAWEQRKYEDELSALQHAENLLIERGEEAFSAEYQNDPIGDKHSQYELDENTVASRVNGLKRHHMPAGAPFVTAMIDINYYGLHWVSGGWENNRTGYLPDYGKFPAGNKKLYDPKTAGGVQADQAVFEGLSKLVPMLGNISFFRGKDPASLDLLLIDCGFHMDTVFKWIAVNQKKFPFHIIASRGRASTKYRQTKPIGRPGDNWHQTEFAGKGRVIVHNSDYWRVQTQKAFLLSPGAPGSISLYGDNPKKHRNIAEHVAAEQLVDFRQGDVTDFYKWAMKPGSKNDLLDCAVAATVAASVLGADPNGAVVQRTKPKRKRRRVSYSEV